MKNRFIMATAFLITAASGLKAQEFKLAKSTGTLDIKEVNEVTIEGYSGNEIIFTSSDREGEGDDRAKGLRAINSLGLDDNTGIGLSVVEKGGVIEVRQLKKTDGPDVRIKVPRGVKISYSHTSPYGGDVKLKNIEGEVEVSTVHNGVQIDNVTGPLLVKTVHGGIDASFADASKNKLSLISVHGHVDASLPVTTKANLRMGTSYGQLFVDPAFKLEIEQTGNMVKYSDNVSAKINGGGIEITLSSTHSNVYLRKK